MKHILSIAVTAIAFCTLANDEYISPITGKPIPKDSKYTVAQIKERDERVLRKTGGFIDIKANGISVAILDGRQKPGGAAIQFSDVFSSLSKSNVRVERKPLNPNEDIAEKALAFRKTYNAGYAIVIVNHDKLMGLTVMPEERLAIINATRYENDDHDPLKPEVRVHKEIWRALGFAAGLGYAPYQNDVLQPTFNISELDALYYQVMQPMNFQKIHPILKKFGITREHRVPYHIACQEGWAPTPTNEYQKAIWDKVHAMPTAPIKIKPETKKVVQ